MVDSSPFEGNKLVAQKTASLENFGGDGTKTELLWGMTIPKEFQKREEFGFVKQYFNYEHRGLADSCFCEAEGKLFFQFVMLFWFLDLFPDADFSKIYRNKLAEFLKLIYVQNDVRYFDKTPDGEIQILSGHIDAFLEGSSSHEKMAFVWYLYYMECFTETSIAFDWNRMDGIASTWGTKMRRFVGVLSDDRAELLLERLSKKCQFWEDPDFIPVLTDALEKRGLRYLEKLNDKGSTAILYKALDPHTDQKAAIKVYMRVGQDIERDFRDMRDQLKRIKNPYFVKILSDGHFTFKGEEIYYFVEEFIEGKSLDAIPEEILLSKSYSDRIKLVYMLATALDAIHNAYEAHNDLHEGNILIVNDPLTLKIIDPRSSLHSPASGSPDFKDFFTLLSRFLNDGEKKDLGISIAEQDSIAFEKLREKLDYKKGGIMTSSKPLATGIITRVLEVNGKSEIKPDTRTIYAPTSNAEINPASCKIVKNLYLAMKKSQWKEVYTQLLRNIPLFLGRIFSELTPHTRDPFINFTSLHHFGIFFEDDCRINLKSQKELRREAQFSHAGERGTFDQIFKSFLEEFRSAYDADCVLDDEWELARFVKLVTERRIREIMLDVERITAVFDDKRFYIVERKINNFHVKLRIDPELYFSIRQEGEFYSVCVIGYFENSRKGATMRINYNGEVHINDREVVTSFNQLFPNFIEKVKTELS